MRWGVAGRMAGAWVLTIPSAALVAALIGVITHNGGTVSIVAVTLVAAVVLLGVWLRSRRDPVNASNVNDKAPATDRQLAGAHA